MATQWYYKSSGEEHGPVSSSELHKLARSDVISPNTYLRQEGVESWFHANRLKGLFSETPKIVLPALPTHSSGKSPPITTPPPLTSSAPVGPQEESSGGIPFWMWGVMGAALIFVVGAIFMFSRNGTESKKHADQKTEVSKKTDESKSNIKEKSAESRVSQAVAIAYFRKLGGIVTVDEKRPGKPVIKLLLTLSKVKVTDAELVHLHLLRNLKVLSLDNTKVTDTGLEQLKGLKDLQNLYLHDTEVTDAGLVNLKRLSNLEWLGLDRTSITDAGLVHLKGLANLRTLDLSYTKVTDSGLVHLNGLTKLKSLHLNGTKVTKAGIKKLKKALPNCYIAVPLKIDALIPTPAISSGRAGSGTLFTTAQIPLDDGLFLSISFIVLDRDSPKSKRLDGGLVGVVRLDNLRKVSTHKLRKGLSPLTFQAGTRPFLLTFPELEVSEGEIRSLSYYSFSPFELDRFLSSAKQLAVKYGGNTFNIKDRWFDHVKDLLRKVDAQSVRQGYR